MSESKEYRFQLVVVRDSVKLIAENGAEYTYPRDTQGVKEIIRFIVGKRKPVVAPRRFPTFSATNG